MDTEKKEEAKTELDLLFPEKKVALPDGTFVTVRPLSIKDLPKALNAYTNLFLKVTSGIPPAQAAIEALSDSMLVLPFCIDRDIAKIPSTVAPELLQAMVELNITDEVVKKWEALAENLTRLTTKSVPGVTSVKS